MRGYRKGRERNVFLEVIKTTISERANMSLREEKLRQGEGGF